MTTSKQSIPSVSTTDLRKYLDYLKSVRQTASSTPKGVFMKQFSFSGKGHLTAIDPVYKQFFGQECEVMDVTGSDNPYDTNIGVDYIVDVKNPRLQTSVEIWVQERFRTLRYQHYQCVTLIECNKNSGHLSEIYKTKAQYLVYGYYDDTTNTLAQAVVVNLPSLVRKIAMNQIKFEIIHNNTTNQNFISVKFEELKKHNLIEFEFTQA